MRTLRLLSPAKLNLFLRVNFKRTDGFHDLTTLFERISLCDEITFKPNSKGVIRIFCAHPHVPRDERNLVYQAADLLKKDFSVKQGVDISIVKNIPVAAGLGGGSSNAATALLAFNQLWRLALPFSALLAYAKKLGSDVPFFLYDCAWAVGTNRGDVIKKIRTGTNLWHVLVVPRIKVYTRKVFENLKLTKKNADVNILRRALEKNDLLKAGGLLFNDLETALVRLHPNLLRIKKRLEKLGAQGVCFSGSGPSVFGLAQSKKDAEKIRSTLLKKYSRVFVVATSF